MAQIRQETRLELDKRDLLALCASAPQTLVCAAGEVWITFDGRQEDVILRTGERLDLDGRHGTVISALCAATLLIAPQQVRGIACLLGPERAPWAAARRLRWKFPALSLLPSTQLR